MTFISLRFVVILLSVVKEFFFHSFDEFRLSRVDVDLVSTSSNSFTEQQQHNSDNRKT